MYYKCTCGLIYRDKKREICLKCFNEFGNNETEFLTTKEEKNLIYTDNLINKDEKIKRKKQIEKDKIARDERRESKRANNLILLQEREKRRNARNIAKEIRIEFKDVGNIELNEYYYVLPDEFIVTKDYKEKYIMVAECERLDKQKAYLFKKVRDDMTVEALSDNGGKFTIPIISTRKFIPGFDKVSSEMKTLERILDKYGSVISACLHTKSKK